MNHEVHPAIAGLQAQAAYPYLDCIQEDANAALSYIAQLHDEINALRGIVAMMADGYEVDLVVGMKNDLERWRDAMEAILELLDDEPDGPHTAHVDKY